MGPVQSEPGEGTGLAWSEESDMELAGEKGASSVSGPKMRQLLASIAVCTECVQRGCREATAAAAQLG